MTAVLGGGGSPPKRQRCDEADSRAQRSPLVLSVGVACLDHTYVVDTFPAPDSKHRARSQRTSGGGNAANSAVAMARLGVGTRLVTKVGPDVAGTQIKAELLQEGVCCDGVVVGNDGEQTITATVIVHGSTRTIIAMPLEPRVRDLTAAHVSPHMLENVALLQLDGRHPLAAQRAAKLARERSVPILAEAELRSGRDREEQAALAALLSCADYVVTSEHYPCASTGKASVTEGLKSMLETEACRAKWAVATLGEHGCVAVCRPTSAAEASDAWPEVRAPSWPVTVVDTTGAGDAFIGGLAYAIVSGQPLESALQIASWVAAQKCRGEGCRTTLPTLKQLLDAARTEEKLRVSCANGLEAKA